jgi:hypothetical protein
MTGGSPATLAATWAWPSQNYLTDHRSSQIIFEFDDSLQIGTCDGVDSNQKVKVSQRVPVPLSFDPRNLAGGEPTQRRNTAHGTSSVQEVRMILEGSWRCTSSPWSFCRGQSRGLLPGSSMNSWIPAMHCGRERLDLCCPLLPLLDSFKVDA